MPEKVRIITALAKISDDTFDIVSEPDQKGVLQLRDPTGKIIKVHQERIQPISSAGKAIATYRNGILMGICPGCVTRYRIFNGEIECQTHGVFKVVVPGDEPVNSIAIIEQRSIDQTNQTKPKSEPNMTESTGPTIVDLKQIAAYGIELWTKSPLKFDHPKVDAKAHELLADNPPRKLCFNTYDGSLNKTSQDPINELRLADFRDNKPTESGKHQGKMAGYLLKLTLDEERQRLTKSGFKKAELQ